MPSSYSTSLRFELQFTGENINLWGDKLNSAISRIDSAIAGWTAISLASLSSYALTTANGSADEARSAMIKFTGSPTANIPVTIPPVSKSYLIWNATDKIVTITMGAGETVAIDADDIVTVICDGSANVKTLGFDGLALKDFIAASVVNTADLPALTGNAGKYAYNSAGTAVIWRQIVAADISDFDDEVRAKTLVYSLVFGG